MRGSSQWNRSSQCGSQIQEKKRCPSARGFTARATQLAPIDRIGYMVYRFDPFIGRMKEQHLRDRIAGEEKREVGVAPQHMELVVATRSAGCSFANFISYLCHVGWTMGLKRLGPEALFSYNRILS
jgi:hypothetical protein